MAETKGAKHKHDMSTLDGLYAGAKEFAESIYAKGPDEMVRASIWGYSKKTKDVSVYVIADMPSEPDEKDRLDLALRLQLKAHDISAYVFMCEGLAIDLTAADAKTYDRRIPPSKSDRRIEVFTLTASDGKRQKSGSYKMIRDETGKVVNLEEWQMDDGETHSEGRFVNLLDE